MGTHGMRASLISREVIADSIELTVRGHLFDGVVAMSGCDKTIPATVMALVRLDLPSLMIYGGSIQPGRFGDQGRHHSGCLRSGRRPFRRQNETRRFEAARGRRMSRRRRVRRSVHRQHDGVGERTSRHLADGFQQYPRDRSEKARERFPGRSTRSRSSERNLRPSQIITKNAIENAIASVAMTGGSTNAVLHLLAIAHEAGIAFDIDDFDRISSRTPLLADLKPGGRFMATDMYKAGGIPLVAKRLKEAGLLHQNEITVTGKTIGAEADAARETAGQEVVRPLRTRSKKRRTGDPQGQPRARRMRR